MSHHIYFLLMNENNNTSHLESRSISKAFCPNLQGRPHESYFYIQPLNSFLMFTTSISFITTSFHFHFGQHVLVYSEVPTVPSNMILPIPFLIGSIVCFHAHPIHLKSSQGCRLKEHSFKFNRNRQVCE